MKWDWEYRYFFRYIWNHRLSSYVKTIKVEEVKMLGFKSAKVDASVVPGATATRLS
jgi:hypothetical protein